jgi:hypothetical protein
MIFKTVMIILGCAHLPGDSEMVLALAAGPDDHIPLVRVGLQ